MPETAMTDRQRRQPPPDRARKRAIRAQAKQAGVPYSVAARQLELAARNAAGVLPSGQSLMPGEMLAGHGRTIYPIAADPDRQRWFESRNRRSFDERVRDTRLAAALPTGRARHLTERFPPSRGRPGSGVGLLYHGDGREETIAMLYQVVFHEAPGLIPAIGDLAWIAEMGEETAVDTACAEVDRTARRLVDQHRGTIWARIETALAAGEGSVDWRIRQEAGRLRRMYDMMLAVHEDEHGAPYATGLPLDGVRQILDAVLIVADDGHAAGTRVRLVGPPNAGRMGTIVGAQWGPSGPPVGYQVCLDETRDAVAAQPNDLIVLAHQEGAFVG
jgi:hypothetical protein